MSEVISFRLNPENHREAHALQILEKRIAEGYTIRQIITDALIHSEDQNHESEFENRGINLQATLIEISYMLNQIMLYKDKDEKPTDQCGVHENLTDSFLSSVKLSIKPGIKQIECVGVDYYP